MVLALQDNWTAHLSIYDHLPQLVPITPTDSLFERPTISVTRPARSRSLCRSRSHRFGDHETAKHHKYHQNTKLEQAIQRNNRRSHWRSKSQLSSGTALFNVTEISCWPIALIAAKRVPAPRLRYSWVGAVGARATP